MATLPSRFGEEFVVQDFYRPQGHAYLSFEWGTYDGNLSMNVANGYGVQQIRRRTITGYPASEEMAIYRGDWKEGKREGYGRMEIPWENKVYEGGWMNGKGSGWGRSLKMKDGWIEEWEDSGFRDGYRHGWGVTCVTANDPKETIWYTGGFKEGDRHGYCVKSTGSTEEYISVRHGVTHGFCTFMKHGQIYNQDFYLDGRAYNRPGIQVAPSLLPSQIFFSIIGACYHGQSHTLTGSANTANGDTYNGNLSYGTPHGYGTLQCAVAHRLTGTYEGGWKHGYACGYGTWMGSEGLVYAGGWLNGKPYGYGKITSAGNTYETFWDGKSGWRFESPTNLGSPYVPFRVPSPAPIPRNWEM